MGTGVTRGAKSAASLGDWIAAESIELAAETVNIPASEIRSPSRERAKAAFARQIAMYVTHCAGRVSMAELAAIFDRDRSTVAHAVACIEERRDDAYFNARIELVEAALNDRLAAIVKRWKRDAERARARAQQGGLDRSAPVPIRRRRSSL
jgi:chromosomal replication initiation ATPase DnaA